MTVSPNADISTSTTRLRSRTRTIAGGGAGAIGPIVLLVGREWVHHFQSITGTMDVTKDRTFAARDCFARAHSRAMVWTSSRNSRAVSSDTVARVARSASR